jgi:hypothetical protein
MLEIKMHIQILSENLKGGDSSKDLGVLEIILKWVLGKEGGKLRTG